MDNCVHVNTFLIKLFRANGTKKNEIKLNKDNCTLLHLKKAPYSSPNYKAGLWNLSDYDIVLDIIWIPSLPLGEKLKNFAQPDTDL